MSRLAVDSMSINVFRSNKSFFLKMPRSSARLSTMDPATDPTNTTVYVSPDVTDSLRWGLHVIAAGVSEIPPGSSYPAKAHPDEYLFSWEKGRVLNEYQLIYISSGHGVFESAQTEKITIEAGQVILLFPGIWHRYKPSAASGWHENWISFNGDVARRIMVEYFMPAKPIVQLGHDRELITLIKSTAELLQKEGDGYQHRATARVMEALAIIEPHRPLPNNKQSANAVKIQKARIYLTENFAQAIDMYALAIKYGMSYALFGKLFKKITGKGPKKYLVDIRIDKARELLRHTELSVSEIAEKTGFTTIYFFSRLFKRWEGRTPLSYRKRLGEKIELPIEKL